MTKEINSYPTISCLTITKNRLYFLKQSIQCFIKQSYLNKELIIISCGDSFYNASIQRYLGHINQDNIVLKTVSEQGYSLNQLRNMAWDLAGGALICRWDDDDQFHPRRLEIQYQHLVEQQADVSFLVDQLKVFWDDQTLFLNELPKGSEEIKHRLISKTMLCSNTKKYQYLEQKNKGNNQLINNLLDNGASITGLTGEAGLFLHQYHGDNSQTKEQHLNAATSHSVTEERLMAQLPLIKIILEEYNLPIPLGICIADKQLAVYETL